VRTCICKDLLWEVVNQLPVDEAVDAVADDLLALFTHFLLSLLLQSPRPASAQPGGVTSHEHSTLGQKLAQCDTGKGPWQTLVEEHGSRTLAEDRQQPLDVYS